MPLSSHGQQEQQWSIPARLTAEVCVCACVCQVRTWNGSAKSQCDTPTGRTARPPQTWCHWRRARPCTPTAAGGRTSAAWTTSRTESFARPVRVSMDHFFLGWLLVVVVLHLELIWVLKFHWSCCCLFCFFIKCDHIFKLACWHGNLNGFFFALVMYLTVVVFLFISFFLSSVTTSGKKSKSAFQLQHGNYQLLFFVAVKSDQAKLPFFVHDSLQSPVRFCRPWSLSAWWSFWAFLHSFGSSTKDEIPARLFSRLSSTTRRSGSWKQISRAWWRLRRRTARHRTLLCCPRLEALGLSSCPVGRAAHIVWDYHRCIQHFN